MKTFKFDKSNPEVVELVEALKNQSRGTEDFLRGSLVGLLINEKINPFCFGAVGFSEVEEADLINNKNRLLLETILNVYKEAELIEVKSKQQQENYYKNLNLTITSENYFKFNDSFRLEALNYYLKDIEDFQYKLIDLEDLNNKTFKIIKTQTSPKTEKIKIMANNINYFEGYKNLFRHFEFYTNKLDRFYFIDLIGLKNKKPGEWVGGKYTYFNLIESLETKQQYYILNYFITTFL
jgi:hypothetical protein